MSFFSLMKRLAVVACALFVLFLLTCKIFYPDDLAISHKFFKSNPEFIHKKKNGYLIICRKENFSAELEAYLTNPDRPFLEKKGWIKDEIKRSITSFKLDDKKYILKRHNCYNFYHWFRQVIPHKCSNAMRSFYYSYVFDRLHINTPKSIALVEKRYGPFYTTTYHFMEEIDGVIGLDYFDSSKESEEMDYRSSIKETVDIAKRLDDANIIHGNLRLVHFFYVKDKPYLIDLDTVHHYRYRTIFYKNRQNRHDLDRLVMGMKDKLGPKDHEYFRKYYQKKMK